MYYQIYRSRSDTIDDLNEELAQYTNITHLGIQCKPGIQFTINNSGTFTMNNLGIFELELNDNMPTILSIQYVEGDLGNFPLIIDIIGDKKEGESNG